MSGLWSTRRPARTQRLGGALLILGLWVGIGWLAWELVWPGPTPEILLSTPPPQRVLPLDAPVEISGVSSNVRRLRCEGRDARPDGRGHFRLLTDGPTRPGMFVLRCEAENNRGRRFPFSYGRIAGTARPLIAPITDAVVVVFPLHKLKQQGGLLHGLSKLVSGRVAKVVIAAAKQLVFRYDELRLGPVYLGGLTLLGIDAAGGNRLAITIGLKEISVGLRFPDKWLSGKAPTWARFLLAMLAGQKRLKLLGTFPLKVLVSWTPGKPPTLQVGPISTAHLKKALGFAFLADAANAMLALLSQQLHTQLNRALKNAKAVMRRLDAVHRRVQRRLARMSGLLPPPPKMVSPRQVAACLKLRLSHLSTDRRAKLVRFHLTAQIAGYTSGGRLCADPRAVKPIRVGSEYALRRLSIGPPRLDRKYAGPALVISHDLINAYLATMWAAGGLSAVPVRLPEIKQHGFDIRRLDYRLPPVVTTAPSGRLRLEVPELEVSLHTLGEPRRLFAAQLGLDLRILMDRPGHIRFAVPRTGPPRIHVRCLREAGGACAAQSRRFQDLVNIGTELAFSKELAGPQLAIEAALPTLRGPGVKIEVSTVRPIPRGILVQLRIE